MESLIFEFSITELIALFGLAQSVYVLVYMGLRAGQLSRAFLPILFFATLSAAFLLSVAQSRWEEIISFYSLLQWGVWVLCAPLSALLVLQIARITKAPQLSYFLIILFVPLAYGAALLLDNFYDDFKGWLSINGIIVGAISLLIIWIRRDWLNQLYHRKNGKERFWLIMALIILNIGLLTINLLLLYEKVTLHDAEMIRVIIGISFAYIASTSLFRLYPYAISTTPKADKKEGDLSDDDIEVALKIENLLYRDKVYQEPSYGRSEMARELSLTDSNLSKIINLHFKKSVPQLLNELRVQEARVLLKQTDADVTTISQESGFNSIATFNRVFKEVEGVSPSEYRSKKR